MTIRVAMTIIMVFQATNGDCNHQNYCHDSHNDILYCHDFIGSFKYRMIFAMTIVIAVVGTLGTIAPSPPPNRRFI